MSVSSNTDGIETETKECPNEDHDDVSDKSSSTIENTDYSSSNDDVAENDSAAKDATDVDQFAENSALLHASEEKEVTM